jgi:Divergent InlB B-repeat domain
VTAISTGPGNAGIEAAHSSNFGNTPSGEIVAENTVARGGPGGADIEVEPIDRECNPGPCEAGNAEIGYSNFVTTSPTGVDTTTIGHNQSADPRFVNGTVGPSEDFHLQIDSPLIGAGIEDAQTGTSDLGGGPRPVVAGSPPSIGAYEPPVQTLTVGVSGNGSVSGVGIGCPGTCSSSYLPGTKVTLTATPGPGEVLAGWGGACSGTTSCQVTMSTDHDLTATFVPASKKSEEPSNSFTIGKVSGGKLEVDVASAGSVQLIDLDGTGASGSRSRKKTKPLLKPASGSGGPGEIKLALKETAPAKAVLKQKGKLMAHVKVTFTPVGGTADSKTAVLRIKRGR